MAVPGDSLSAFLFGAAVACGLWSSASRAAGKRRRVTADEVELERKLQVIRDGGVEKMQVIMDFDRTITTYWGPRGGRGSSCHGIAESLRGNVIKAKADALNEYYYPLEVSPTLSRVEKIPHMVAWYQAINNLLIESGFRRTDLTPSVEQANVSIRPGVKDIFSFCEGSGVPLLVFSAGVGDVLKEVIRQKIGAMPRKSAIVSNWMRFNEEGALVDWTQPLIHMFNKDDSQLLTSDLHPELCKRGNVVLIGDSLGDACMADGGTHDVVLKVGLLNDNVEALMGAYLAAFDLVLTGDTSLEYIVEQLRLAAPSLQE